MSHNLFRFFLLKDTVVIVRNMEVFLEGSLILRCNGAHARGSMGPDSGPILDTLSLCQDDINLIVTCFNAVFKFLLELIAASSIYC